MTELYSKRVEDLWQKIKGSVDSGIPYSFHLSKLELLHEELKKKVSEIQSVEDNEDIIDAISNSTWVLEYGLKHKIFERETLIKICQSASEKSSDLSIDILKFSMKSLAIAHGAIALSAMAALSQGGAEGFDILLFWIISISFAGFLLAGIGLLRFYHVYNEKSSKYLLYSTGVSSSSDIKNYMELVSRHGLFESITVMGFFYASFILIFTEGIISLYILWGLLES